MIRKFKAFWAEEKPITSFKAWMLDWKERRTMYAVMALCMTFSFFLNINSWYIIFVYPLGFPFTFILGTLHDFYYWWLEEQVPAIKIMRQVLGDEKHKWLSRD